MAQDQPDRANLPDAPVPKQDPAGAAQKPDKTTWQTPMGLITKKSFFYPELATTPGSLSSLQKFELFLDKSISPPQILSSAAAAGISEARGTLAVMDRAARDSESDLGRPWPVGLRAIFLGRFCCRRCCTKIRDTL